MDDGDNIGNQPQTISYGHRELTQAGAEKQHEHCALDRDGRDGKSGGDILTEELCKLDSLLQKVNCLHERVHKPRDQVADAEALLKIAECLSSSLKSIHNSGKILPSEFISRLLEQYAENGETEEGNSERRISWINVGVDSSRIFGKAAGLQTMIGPMDASLTRKRLFTRRKRPRTGDISHPEEVEDALCNNKTGTQTRVSVMFDILKRQKLVQLEKLVLSRESFSETVENIFALSFLVKDGRSEILVNDGGMHLVSPRNAPKAAAVANGEISQHQFVFRFDFRDWKLMKDHVKKGEELMPRYGGGLELGK